MVADPPEIARGDVIDGKYLVESVLGHGGMVEARLAMGTSACFAAGLGGFTVVDLDTPLFLAEDPFDGGYTQDGERIDLRSIDRGHGCTPAMREDLRKHDGP